MAQKSIRVQGKILTANERPYVGKDGSQKVFRDAIVQIGESVVKLPFGDFAIKDVIGQECSLALEFYSFGNDISAKVRIVGVEAV